MGIESITDVITVDNAGALDGVLISSANGFGEVGNFMWGVKYRANSSPIIEVELVYKGQKKGRIYLVKTSERQVEFIEPGITLYGQDEHRLEFFKSPEDYIKFFEALNLLFRKEKIEKNDYAILLDKFRSLYATLPVLSIGQAIAILHYAPNHRSLELQKARKTLSSFPLVQMICSEAGISLL